LTALFPDNLTPQRDYLVRKVRRGIEERTLNNSDLMMLVLHLREMRFDPAFSDWGNSVAHVRRSKGAVWKQTANIWATHLFFINSDDEQISLRRLPVPIYETLMWVIDFLSDWQLKTDFDDLFPGGITRAEAKSTLEHLYSAPSSPMEEKSNPASDPRVGFVFLVNERGCDPRDLVFVRRLIEFCDVDALNVPPKPMLFYVDIFERALRRLGIPRWRLDDGERTYLQLHFLSCLHNTIIAIDYDALGSLLGKPTSGFTAILAASAMQHTLSLDIGFYYRKPNGCLDQVDLQSGDERFPNLTYPVIVTDLPEQEYLLENDTNIIASLVNHPLDVVMYNRRPRLIALDRGNSEFPPTRNRAIPRRGDPTALLKSLREDLKT
jgi:hypothetical protein